MAIDDSGLRGLLEQSDDLHTRRDDDDTRRSRRIRRARARRSVAGRRRRHARARRCCVACRSRACSPPPVSAPRWSALLASPAFADKTMDVQMLQTAASIENLAVATYDDRAHARLHRWRQRERRREGVRRRRRRTSTSEHAEAFNAAVTRLGGKAQDQPDPVLLGVVNNAKPTLTGPGGGRRPRPRARGRRRADLRGQHRHVLEQERTGRRRQHHGCRGAARRDPQRGEGARSPAVRADLIALPPDAAKLPAAAGSVGFPDAFFPTTDARPANEGAVQ